jgi:hypothetical protein
VRGRSSQAGDRWYQGGLQPHHADYGGTDRRERWDHHDRLAMKTNLPNRSHRLVPPRQPRSLWSTTGTTGPTEIKAPRLTKIGSASCGTAVADEERFRRFAAPGCADGNSRERAARVPAAGEIPTMNLTWSAPGHCGAASCHQGDLRQSPDERPAVPRR